MANKPDLSISLKVSVHNLSLRIFLTKNILLILFSEAGMVAFVFACIVLHFPSKPKHPPSITSTMERTAFLPSVISICTNPQVGFYHLIHPFLPMAYRK